MSGFVGTILIYLSKTYECLPPKLSTRHEFLKNILRTYLSLKKAKTLGNAFIDRKFNYTSIIWMFCKKITYLKMHKTHHKTLKVIYQPETSFEDLLEVNNSVSIHRRLLPFLITEIYRSTINANPEFTWSIIKDGDVSLILGGPGAFHLTHKHCVKSVRIGSYSGPHFAAADQNNPEYGHFSRNEIQLILAKTLYLSAGF